MRWWQAEYRIGDFNIAIPGVSTNECPVSLLTPASKTLLSLSTRAHWLHERGGLSPFPTGAGLSSRLADALEVLAVEEARTNHEIEEVLRKRR